MGIKFPDLPPLLDGESVTVFRPSTSYDDHMNEVAEWVHEDVHGVLVAPGQTSGLSDGMRPHGARASLSLAFPTTFSATLRGCRVAVRGREYAVVGDPQPRPANCPTDWDLVTEVEAVDG